MHPMTETTDAAACREYLNPSRRGFLGTAAASLAMWGFVPRPVFAGRRDPRLLVMVLRGGLDGLSLAGAVGDPHYARVREAAALTKSGRGAGHALDSLFVLNPSMKKLAELYARREALLVHAVATPYRERSHFDAQDVLENGLPGVGRREDGWLNRAVLGLPDAGRVEARRGLAIGAVVPLVMRGKAPVLSWMPAVYNSPTHESTIGRLGRLYAHADPRLAAVFAEGREVERVGGMRNAPKTEGARRDRQFVDTAAVAARFLSEPAGPRIGVLSYNGWDTHANEGTLAGTLANQLAGLDAAIDAFRAGIGDAWKDTIVVIVTEFGRTVRLNGTAGTDHGTATAAILIGGAVAGGRVITDWPGLSSNALYEGRDLAPTMDLRAVLKGVLADHLDIPKGALARTIFPDSERLPPLAGLVRAV
jgi:uncharacterized protein (DUF1501 family)